MNKSTKQKQSFGKISPLSKRPKLDFTPTTGVSFKENSDFQREPSNGCEKVVLEKLTGNPSEQETDQTLSMLEWDDDFSEDMLEKVCLIADFSQAVDKYSRKTPNSPNSPKSLTSTTDIEIKGFYEELKLQFEKLQEKLRTKEGEVHILRSRLKQNEDAKQALALQNIKVIDEIQGKYNDKLSSAEKELESTRSKLLFKDLEYKILSERCRLLEHDIARSKIVEPQPFLRSLVHLSQITDLTLQAKENYVDNHFSYLSQREENLKLENFDYNTPIPHEGKNLANILCPEFFKYVCEPNVVPFYFYCTENHKKNAGKKKIHEWNDLPYPTAHVKDLYVNVCSLFTFENFTQKKVVKLIHVIFNTCEKILYHQNQMFKFLDKFELCNIEHRKADLCLLDKEEAVQVISIKNLLNCKKLNEEECGIELRRSLGLVSALLQVSKTAFDMIKTNMTFLTLFKDTVASIGKLRRPLRYAGVLIGIAFILQKLLKEKNLGKECLNLIIETVEELIFARPKLDVLREVINILAAGKHHVDLLAKLCRRESIDSCVLYMDCKLKQVMFFKKNACPLKLLCMQIIGLACLPCNQNIRWDITDCVIKWLNGSLSTESSKNLKWLPTYPGFNEEDRCFNVTQCLLQLLILCLNDYNLSFMCQDTFDDQFTKKKTEIENRKKCLISVIGQGAVLFRRILKADQRQLHDSSYSLRLSLLLKALMHNKSNQCQMSLLGLSSVEVKAISWINNLLESELRMQDCCSKQSIYKLPDTDVFHSLKINEGTRIF